MCVFCVVAVQGGFQVWVLAVLVALAVICFIITLLIGRQPESKTKLSFKVNTHLHVHTEHFILSSYSGFKDRWVYVCTQVPLLPFLPVLSMFINVYLMMQLDRGTWMRFAIWMAIGKSISGWLIRVF